MMGFQKRIQNSTKFEKELFQKLEEMGFYVALNGTEHTHPTFADKLRQSNDPTSLSIRFQPDGVICTNGQTKSAYVEVKASENIEKTAYEQYMKLHNNENIVLIVFEKFKYAWNFIQHIDLIDGNITVKPFPPTKRFPVDKNGWICPRKAKHWNNVSGNNASGTPYKAVNQQSLLPWNHLGQLKSLLNNTLTTQEIITYSNKTA